MERTQDRIVKYDITVEADKWSYRLLRQLGEEYSLPRTLEAYVERSRKGVYDIFVLGKLYSSPNRMVLTKGKRDDRTGKPEWCTLTLSGRTFRWDVQQSTTLPGHFSAKLEECKARLFAPLQRLLGPPKSDTRAETLAELEVAGARSVVTLFQDRARNAALEIDAEHPPALHFEILLSAMELRLVQ
ncbi:hypothetical protein DFH06DRAFT_1136243 [Mycena polygramma]|nr:hypothetical protein DFH06DRAFT_1136243 [Mycena polygramma]